MRTRSEQRVLLSSSNAPPLTRHHPLIRRGHRTGKNYGQCMAKPIPVSLSTTINLDLPAMLYNNTEALKSAAATMKAKVELDAGDGDVDVAVLLVAAAEGSLAVPDGITEDERGELLSDLEDVACKDVAGCSVSWDDRRRRVLRRSLATINLQYTVRLELNKTNPEIPKASCHIDSGFE